MGVSVDLLGRNETLEGGWGGFIVDLFLWHLVRIVEVLIVVRLTLSFETSRD